MADMMRQIWIDEFGGTEALRMRETAAPQAGPGQVRVRVRAASLNPVDWKIFGGGAASVGTGFAPPMGVGNDIAGTIDQVGAGVTGFTVGDRVFGSARVKALQDFTVLDVPAVKLARIPDGLDDPEAACLVVAGRTAWDGVESLGVTAGETLLVHGAAGGVGQYAVQLAVRKGVRVIGTASPHNHDLLRELGAEPVDYRGDLAAKLVQLAPLHAAFDAADGSGVLAATANGVDIERCITVGAKGTGGARGVATDLETHGALDELAALAVRGELRTRILGRYSLNDAAEAYHEQMTGSVAGKLIVQL
ncbi:NADP-dependent oxidoreductase [Agrococcus casei]|uniref:NADP-dependent oxidoreductase n=1 Tax=Agrococcus casei TaxID=343512 RepID=UPI003F936C70